MRLCQQWLKDYKFFKVEHPLNENENFDDFYFAEKLFPKVRKKQITQV